MESSGPTVAVRPASSAKSASSQPVLAAHPFPLVVTGAEEAATDSSTDAGYCIVSGDGLSTATVREVAEFSIIAHDANGKPRVTGGDSFFVAVRGGSHVRARVRDNEDGSYHVTYTPSVSTQSP